VTLFIYLSIYLSIPHQADEVDGGFSQKSLFMRVKDLDPWSSQKGKNEEKSFNFSKLINQDSEIPGTVNPYGYGIFQSLSDLPTQADDENISNISHITVESTAMSRTHSMQQGLESDRRNEGSAVPESVRTRSQLDRLFQCNFNEANTSYSSECSSLHLYPNGRPSQAHTQTPTHTAGHGPRPLPDQTAFDRGLCSPRNASPVLLTATPSRPCPATPMRTPSWGADRGGLDSEDQFSERSSSSAMSQVAHTRISSLTQNKVFISLSDSISTADVSFHRDFIHEGFLGAGSFAEVYMAREKDGKVYAVKKNKRPFRSIKDRNILIDEVTIMKKLGESPCVHLVRLIRAWQEDGYFFVQIELAERGTLRDLLTATAASGKTLSESTVWHIAHDVAKGLQHVHNCGIVHLGTLRLSMSSSIIKFCLSSSALTRE
jgi:Protein kinase domain